MSNSSRVCIFCGERPEGKNNEHILPQWLLELTGDQTRVVTHGYDRIRDKEHRFSFSRFEFPACTKCNDNLSNFEGQIKDIVIRLNSAQDLKAGELDRAPDLGQPNLIYV
jgi:hypothetical protein